MLSGRSAQTARRVIVPSESAREDAIEAFHLDPDRVMVIPHGVGTEFASSDDATLPPIEGPYVLYVGTIEPRKNIPLLIKAFNQFRREGFPHKLVLAGGRGWMYDEVERQIAEAAAKDSIVVTEYVKDLVPWYNHADFFVYPSVYEGFGFPPLEAMACGTPAVVSSIRALRELAGDSALYFDPTSIEDLVNLMTLVASNPGERARLAAAGLERASHFTWEETVRKTVEVYRVAVNDG
jgi:glycosyltransferase involved in cell wall biosynthesis